MSATSSDPFAVFFGHDTITSAIGTSAFIERSLHFNMLTVTNIVINVEPKFTEGEPLFLGNLWTGRKLTIPVSPSSLCLP